MRGKRRCSFGILVAIVFAAASRAEAALRRGARLALPFRRVLVSSEPPLSDPPPRERTRPVRAIPTRDYAPHTAHARSVRKRRLDGAASAASLPNYTSQP